MINIKFVICDINREKEITEMVKGWLDFLKQNNIRFTWPEKPIEEEYDIEKHSAFKAKIEERWLKEEQEFVSRLLTFFHKPEDTQFIVEISNYGPLGFYNPANNTVTINLNTHLDPLSTIKHELIHLMVEPYIRKYKIQHSDKEKIVNTLLDSLK